MGDDFEFEREADRDEATALFRGIADGVAAGSIRLEDGDRSVTAAVADDLELSVEFEDEDGDLELEVELEWEDTGESPADRREDVEPPDPAEDEAADRSGEATGDGDVAGSDPGDAAEDGASGDRTPDAAEDRAPDAEDATPAGPERVGPADPAGSLGRFELFTDRGGKWRWRLVHRNGNIVATSGQGYTRKHNAIKGLRSVKGNAPGAAVVVETAD